MDGASGGSRTIADPEGLLRSALEKIVFFEYRVSQLESELAAAVESASRARADAGRAERRALVLEQTLSGEKGARAEADRRAGELHDRVRLLEAERERLLGGLVERARVTGAPGSSGDPAPEEGGADLAGFIAELRAEIDTLRAFRADAEAAGFRAGPPGDARPAHLEAQPPAEAVPAPPAARAEDAARRSASAATVSDLATRFEAAGRVGFTPRDADRVRHVLATRADRALYDRSLDDLGAPDPGRRARAVRALEALGSRAAAPVLAAALGREVHPDVKIALLAALGRFREPFAGDLAARQLSDDRPAVRIAALETLAAVAAGAAADRLVEALSDESPLVRRRAALLLGLQAGERAEEALAIALADADRGVARAAAAALSGRPSARAQGALARGLEHPDPSVRRAAGNALSRVSGEAVDAEAPPSARRAASRRIAERLAGMQGDEIRAAVLRSAGPERRIEERRIEERTAATAAATAPAPVVRRAAVALPAVAPAPAGGARRPAACAPAGPGGAHAGDERHPSASARATVAVLEAPAPAAPAEDGASGLAGRIVAEIRAALRGCTVEGLAAALGEPAPRVGSALQALLASGTVAQRGTRWFMS